jgi:hypothetical protein
LGRGGHGVDQSTGVTRSEELGSDTTRRPAVEDRWKSSQPPTESKADKADYAAWFVEFGKEMFRVPAPDGSLILNIGGSYNPGTPTRSLYHYKLLIELVEGVGFSPAQECFWYNPAKMPVPAEWVTVRRIRLRDSVEYVWWLSKTPWPKTNNRAVLRPYSKDMERLNRKG